MEQEKKAATPVVAKKWASWRRWFRRTDVYIAEYILMLWIFSAFVAVLVGLWFTFFQLIEASGYDARTMAESTVETLGALVVLAPAGYWLYARVTGQEMVQPEVRNHRARTVFLTLWMIGAVGAIVGLSAYAVGTLASMVFGYSDDAGKSFVTEIIPSVLGVLTVTFAVFAIVKRTTRKLAMLSGVVLAALAVVLLIANGIAVGVKKDAEVPKAPQVVCNFSNYLDNKCSYKQYTDYLDQTDSVNGTGGGYNNPLNSGIFHED